MGVFVAGSDGQIIDSNEMITSAVIRVLHGGGDFKILNPILRQEELKQFKFGQILDIKNLGKLKITGYYFEPRKDTVFETKGVVYFCTKVK